MKTAIQRLIQCFLKEKFTHTLKKWGLFPTEEEAIMIVGDQNTPLIEKRGYDSENVPVPSENICGGLPLRVNRVEKRLICQEIMRQKNLDNIVRKAQQENISDMDSVSEKDVSLEWMLKFINLAADISDESLQVIWSKLLTTEIKQPGQVSLHSLFCLSNLSRKEAELFSSISRYILEIDGKFVLLSDKELNAKYGIQYEDIAHLDEYGLFNSSGTLSINIDLPQSRALTVLYGSEAVVFRSKKERIKASISIFLLSLQIKSQ